MPINQRHKKQTENTNHKLGDKNCKDPNYKDQYPGFISLKTTSKKKVEK